MKKTIFKYTIEQPDHGLTISISMRRNAQILSAQYQATSDQLCIWAMVDSNEPIELRSFFIAGTGRPIPNIENGSLSFIGTAQMPNGLVWHVFELTGGAWSIAE